MKLPAETEASDFDPYTYEGSPKVKVLHSYILVACGAGLFYCINYAAIKTGPPAYLTSDVWRWRNTLVSFLHAAIVGAGVLYCLLFKDMFEDAVMFCDNFSYLLVAFSNGYFIYDFFDYLANKKLVSNYEVILHHITVIWVFSYNIQYRMNIGYTIIALMTEVNSIFLHARKLMQMNKWPFDHWLYRFVVGLNLFTFITFRVLGVIMTSYGLVAFWNKNTLTYSVILSAVLFLMYIINQILLWRLIKNDILRNLHYRRLKVNGNNNIPNGAVEKMKSA